MSSVTINRQVRKSFTTTEQSDTYKYRKRKGHDIIRYSLYASGGGAITGVYVLEASEPGANTWITVPDGTFTDTETSGTFVPAGNVDLRWNCTTAGTDITATIG